jgi:hypothetical protein
VLCDSALQSLGIVDPLNFQFLDNPAPEMLIEALLQLYYLVSPALLSFTFPCVLHV